MISTMVQAVADLAQQTQSASGGGIGSDGWKIISALCAFIGGLILWIKALMKEVNDAKDARVADLKENVAYVREDAKDD